MVTKEDLKKIKHLCEKYRINFRAQNELAEVPKEHQEIFTKLESISKMKYNAYVAKLKEAEKKDEWKIEVANAACELFASAELCKSQNESTWRAICETRIVARLSSEITCLRCKNRTWRSEFEVTIDDDTKSSRALRERQKARKPCRCPRGSRLLECLEADGRNTLFCDRNDVRVQLGLKTEDNFKDILIPDKVVGLRKGVKIKDLLWDMLEHEFLPTTRAKPPKNGFLVLDALKPSPEKWPLKQDGEYLYFPFLILEAKAGATNFNWADIQGQTSLPLRSLLESQNSLRKATGSKSQWKSGPWVWFLYNRGGDWRVAGAFIQPDPQQSGTGQAYAYQVVDLWSGSICTKTGALQLLSIIDYIFDWARDNYRLSILKELSTLASGTKDTASVIDSEIASAVNYALKDGFTQRSHPYHEAQKTFEKSGSPGALIRHASFVESRFTCLYITPHNISTFKRSALKEILVKSCKDILNSLQRMEELTQSTLDAIEAEWTGKSRPSRSDQGRPVTYRVAMSSTTYLSETFHQIRELHILAVDRDVWDDLIKVSTYSATKKRRNPIFRGHFDEGVLLRTIKRLRSCRPQDVLLAAITREAMQISMSDDRSIKFSKTHYFHRNIVNFVRHNFTRKGQNPDNTFIRFSQRFEQLHLLEQLYRPSLHKSLLRVSKDGCVLISADTLFRYHQQPGKLCAYLVNDSPTPPAREILSNIVKHAYEVQDVYHTLRGAETKGSLSSDRTYRGSFGREWNIKETYAVYNQGFRFCRFIHALGAEYPLTQGLLSPSEPNGLYLHRKCYSPLGDSFGSMWGEFILYKLFSKAWAYWRDKARTRIAREQPCCNYCAKTRKNTATCSKCYGALHHMHYPVWVKYAILGESPGASDSSEDKQALARLRRYTKVTKPFDNMSDLYQLWKKAEEKRKNVSSKSSDESEESDTESGETSEETAEEESEEESEESEEDSSDEEESEEDSSDEDESEKDSSEDEESEEDESEEEESEEEELEKNPKKSSLAIRKKKN